MRYETMESNKNRIIIEIGVFSGRRNPELSLSGEVAEKLVSMLKTTIGKKSIRPPPTPRLGHYYGFLVRTPKEMAKQLDLPLEFSVYNGVITEGKPQERKYWRDVAQIEKFLFDQAYEYGYGELLKEFGVEKQK
jgi:hypothetical protein